MCFSVVVDCGSVLFVDGCEVRWQCRLYSARLVFVVGVGVLSLVSNWFGFRTAIFHCPVITTFSISFVVNCALVGRLGLWLVCMRLI